MTSTLHTDPASTDQQQTSTPWGQHALLYFVFFLMGAEMYLVSPMLPEVSRELHASTAGAAAVVTAYVLTYAIAGPPFGVLADRFTRRRSIIAGAIVFLFGNLACAIAPTLGLLIAARAVTGLGAAIAAPAIWAYLAERTPPHRRGRVISLGASIYSLGQVLGVPIGAALASISSWRWPFAIVGLGMAVASVVLTMRLTAMAPTAGKRGPAALISPWMHRRIAPGLAATFFLQAGRLGAYTYVGVLFAQRYDFDLRALGLVGLLVGLASMIGSMGTGPILDALKARGISEIWVSAVAALLFAPAAALAVGTGHLYLALAALFVWCLFGGSFYSTQQSYLSSVDPSQRASVVAWNNSMMNAGIAFGTTVLGAVAVGGGAFVTITLALGLIAAVISTGLAMITQKGLSDVAHPQ